MAGTKTRRQTLSDTRENPLILNGNIKLAEHTPPHFSSQSAWVCKSAAIGYVAHMRILLIFKDSIAVERLAISQLSAVLKAAGHEVRLAILGPTPAQDFAEIVSNFAPRVIGYSAMTGEHLALADLNRDLKCQFSFMSVFGGRTQFSDMTFLKT